MAAGAASGAHGREGDDMDEAVLEGAGLTKRFFRKGRESARYFDAVADASVRLAAGQLVVLMGRSGSGKTTLLNMLAGLLAPSAGTVRLAGRSLYELPDDELSRLRNERVGVVPQGQTPLHALTVRENVMLPLTLYGDQDARKAAEAADELLASLGVGELGDAAPAELSGGELRRMAIARALVRRPAVVLADEPTSDLDDENTRVVLGKLREAADGGCAVLVATHDASALEVADRRLRMDAGVLSEEEQA